MIHSFFSSNLFNLCNDKKINEIFAPMISSSEIKNLAQICIASFSDNDYNIEDKKGGVSDENDYGYRSK